MASRAPQPLEVAGSAGTGSPVAVEAHPAGWVLAWSDGDTIRARLADPAGAALAEVRVDDAPLAWPPSRPALAVADDGRVVVGWRAQDDQQRGYGTRLRWLDAELAPLGDSVALGLAPGSTNRIELDAGGDWLAAAWEESMAEGDVVVQLFALEDGRPLTGPMRVHDDLAVRAGGVLELHAEDVVAEGHTDSVPTTSPILRHLPGVLVPGSSSLDPSPPPSPSGRGGRSALFARPPCRMAPVRAIRSQPPPAATAGRSGSSATSSPGPDPPRPSTPAPAR